MKWILIVILSGILLFLTHIYILDENDTVIPIIIKTIGNVVITEQNCENEVCDYKLTHKDDSFVLENIKEKFPTNRPVFVYYVRKDNKDCIVKISSFKRDITFINRLYTTKGFYSIACLKKYPFKDNE